MEKKLYFELKDNCEMNVTCGSLDECMEIIETHVCPDFYYTPAVDVEEHEYTITPIMLTEEEYDALGESDSY